MPSCQPTRALTSKLVLHRPHTYIISRPLYPHSSIAAAEAIYTPRHQRRPTKIQARQPGGDRPIYPTSSALYRTKPSTTVAASFQAQTSPLTSHNTRTTKPPHTHHHAHPYDMTSFHTGRRVSPVTQPASQPASPARRKHSSPTPTPPSRARHTPSTSPIDGSPVKPHYCSPGIPHAAPRLLPPVCSPPCLLARSTTLSPGV